MNKYFVSTLLFYAMSLRCASSSQQIGSPADLLDSNGQKIGTVTKLSASESEFTYDRNKQGYTYSHWITEDGRMKIFEKFDSTTGRLRTRSHYLRGVLNRIEVFDSSGSLRGIVNYPNGVTAQSVELPKKRKIVEFIPQ